jgi:protein-histidine pros-kinase
MGLRLKFNLVLIVVFAIGFIAAGVVSNQLLKQTAREEVLKSAGLMMESAVSVRQYTVDQVRPGLEKLPNDIFLPQTVPAYAATEVLAGLNKKFADYSYKEAALNPTNPRDRTSDWEADIVYQFRKGDESSELVGERDTPSGRQLYLARPIRITNTACLQCHTSAEIAPPAMVKVYGPANGFGWKHDEVIGAQVVSVPMDLPNRNARHSLFTFMSSLAVVFAVVFITINIMLNILIVRPIRLMSAAADKISTGDFSSPEFADQGRDEVAVLSKSFNRMRRSLEKAMQMIEE